MIGKAFSRKSLIVSIASSSLVVTGAMSRIKDALARLKSSRLPRMLNLMSAWLVVQ